MNEDLKGSGNLYGLPGGKLWGKKTIKNYRMMLAKFEQQFGEKEIDQLPRKTCSIS